MRSRLRARTSTPNLWKLLLVIPVVAVLLVPVFNHEDPKLAGVPFFYWYQLLCIPIGVTATLIVYRRTRDDVGASGQSHE